MFRMLAILLLAQTVPGPIDAFRANKALLKVSLRYDYTFRVGLDPSILKQLASGTLRLDPPEEPVYTVTGKWESDGLLEHVFLSRRQDDAKLKSRSYEILEDERTAIFHEFDGLLRVFDRESMTLLPGGPFSWWELRSFPRILDIEVPGIQPTRRAQLRAGRHHELEVYTRSDRGWLQFEFAYDPSIGYLPRFARGILVGTKQTGWIKELFLVDSRSCAAGGFVPTEWYEVSYHIEKFRDHYPNYIDSEPLRSSSLVSLGHFKAVEVHDLTGSVKLEQIESVRFIEAPDRVVSFQAKTNALTISEVNRLLKAVRPMSPSPVPLNMDSSEVGEFRETRSKWSFPYAFAIGGMLMLAGLALYIFFGRRRHSVLVLFLMLSLGCDRSYDSSVLLHASFAQGQILHDSADGAIPVELDLVNEGRDKLIIISISTGCSCRKLDDSLLPALLKPGEKLRIPMQVEGKRQYEPQQFVFAINTDRGM